MTRPDGHGAYGVQEAYDRSAEAWAIGPEQVYVHLAQALVEATPVPLAGARVLDLGAGTGVAGRAALAAGAARVVAVDLAAAMLRSVVDRAPRAGQLSAVQADACALPFAAGSFDVVLAAMSLGHVPEPLLAVREARRVAPGLVASAFAPGWTHPAKAAVDAALAAYGYQIPDWYVRFKAEVEPLVDDPSRLHALATEAGYRDVAVRVVDVPTGLETPAQLAGWRLGMAHLAPFMAALGPTERAAARAAAEAALVGAAPLVVPLVVLSAN
jgi:ubiquinone/menaquinone biosynthesis C-methylase UbiE